VKAGKPSAHFTKDRSGKVICPTILSTQCRYCKEFGHWADIKFCPALQLKDKNERLRAARKQQQVKPETEKKSVSRNMYDILVEEEVKEEKMEKQMMDEFPPLGGVVRAQTESAMKGPSFASMAAKLSECKEPIFQKPVVAVYVDEPRVLDLLGEKQRFHHVEEVYDEEDDDYYEEEQPATLEEWEGYREYNYDAPMFDEYGQQVFSGRDAWD
jgi:hypothetical protein